MAERLAQAMGVTLTQNYEESVLERDFYGVYCGQSALPLAPESIHYLINDTIRDCTVYDYQNNRNRNGVRHGACHGKGTPMKLFLRFSVSDYHGKSLRPKRPGVGVVPRLFWLQHCAFAAQRILQITLVDIRYIQPDYLGQFIDFENCDVLFLYSSLVLNNSDTLK